MVRRFTVHRHPRYFIAGVAALRSTVSWMVVEDRRKWRPVVNRRRRRVTVTRGNLRWGRGRERRLNVPLLRRVNFKTRQWRRRRLRRRRRRWRRGNVVERIQLTHQLREVSLLLGRRCQPRVPAGRELWRWRWDEVLVQTDPASASRQVGTIPTILEGRRGCAEGARQQR